MQSLTRFWRGRSMRKFRRNRMAVAALLVILVYAVIGLWLTVADVAIGAGSTRAAMAALDDEGTLFTSMTLDRVEARVGPLTKRGFLEADTRESRARHINYYISKFKKALALEDAGERTAALRSVRFGERSVSLTPEQAAPLVDQLEKGYHALDAVDDLDGPEGAAAEPKLLELERQVDGLFTPLSGWRAAMYDLRLSMGTDRQGRSTAARAVYSIKVALQIGLIVGLVSVLIGAVLGAAAGYYGGWIDQFVQWLYSTLSSVPDLVLLAVLAYMFTGSYFDDNSKPFLSLVPVYTAMCLTFWIGPCRVIRGETLKLKELEFVQAAKAIGYSRPYILLKHILPNTIHLMFINFSLLFIAAIKFEVVLSFLGLGVKSGPSWGRMIGEATQEVINGNFWQIGAATVFMFVLVLAFNIVSDALQDAFDPKHVG